MIPSNQTPAGRSIRLYTVTGMGTLALMALCVGGWAATTDLSGAVIGTGIVVVDGNVKRIQHREGGIVGQILVRNGAVVKADELLIRLDATVMRANLAIVAKQMAQLEARRMRLVAERDDTVTISGPAPTSLDFKLGDTAEYIAAETSLFAARKRTLHGQKAQLAQRINQIQQENEGLVVRKQAKEEELSWIGQELVRVRNLNEQQLIQFNRLAELERLRAQLDGERGQLIAEIAKAATRITETELQIL
ncbi:HlyD family type I secretion membrane fusion protein [Agrobacterium pusense]|uniref:hypothetical protein n=1 Tax=Agrobacterium pusense TaxID=648995 RepID=UPI002864E2DE|nr:hypothetical protein [Agrobacterium pusense]MDR6189627.1 HlyD family type I secretion membrane fusion protein [Agrobacterium pusense]